MNKTQCIFHFRWAPLTFCKSRWTLTNSPFVAEDSQPLFERRRRSTRVPLNADVTCTVGVSTLNGLVWNISNGGIQLEVTGLKLGDAVGMSFILPHPAVVIHAQGAVVWAQEGRQGLYFTKMSLESQEAIRAYISLG
jgi:hypothetical protein